MTPEKQPSLPGFGDPPAAAPPAGNADPPRSFNLVDEPWILTAASPERKSLRDVFSDPTLCRLSGNPVDKIVVFRLLLSIVQASTNLKDLDAWADLTVDQMAANALAYLDKWHDRFDLFGEHPFLQFPQLAGKGEASSPGSLQVEVSTGNKVVLTDWNLYHELDLPQMANFLLRAASFSCGGKKFDKSIVLSPGHTKKSTGKGGTLLGFAGYMHSYLCMPTILESLKLNLLTDKDIQGLSYFTGGKGAPCWEEMPKGEIDERAEQYRKSYLGELFPLDKFLLIQGNQIIKTDGIGYLGHKEGLVDPAVKIEKGKAVWVRTDKQPWRELPALLAFLEAKDDNAKTPVFLCRGLEKARSTNIETISVWVGGMQVSSNAGEQYVSGKNDYVESEFSFPTKSMGTKEFGRFKDFMKALDDETKVLYASVSGYFRELKTEPNSASDFASAATSRFWEIMSDRAQDAIDFTFSGASDEEYAAALDERKKQWHGVVSRLYNEACPRDTPRQLTAWVKCAPNFKSKSRKEKKS